MADSLVAVLLVGLLLAVCGWLAFQHLGALPALAAKQAELNARRAAEQPQAGYHAALTAVEGVLSGRSRTIRRHQAAFRLFLSSTPSGP